MESFTHEELLRIAGELAYVKPGNSETGARITDNIPITIEIDNELFTIYEKSYDNEKNSGLDCFVVQKHGTEEYALIYVGSDGLNPIENIDARVDVKLGGISTPQQLADADEFYNVVKEKYGDKLKYIAGNSLGGGLSNYIASTHPNDGIFAVTLNPAPLPEGVTPGKNSLNYFTHTDPLARLLKGLGLFDERIPGSSIEISAGIFATDMENLTKNHKGYLGNYQFDMLAPFSVWGFNEMLTERNCQSGNKIRIDVPHMQKLASTMQGKLGNINKVLYAQLDPVYEVVRDEGIKLDDRAIEIKDIFSELVLMPVTIGLESITSIIHPALDRIQAFAMTFPILGWFGAAQIESVQKIIEAFKTLAQQASLYEVPKLFQGVDNGFIDGFVDELIAHHQVIDENLHVLQEQWKFFGDSAQYTVDTMRAMDENLAMVLANGKSTANTLTASGELIWPNTNIKQSQSFVSVQSAMQTKQIMLNNNFNSFVSGIEGETIELLRQIKSQLWYLSTEVSGARGAAVVAFEGTNFAVGFSTEELENIETAYHAVLAELNELEVYISHTAEPIIERLIINFPNVFDELKPYINQALFSGTKYGTIQALCSEALNHLKNLKLEFKNISYQLEIHEAEAIRVLHEKSGTIAESFELLQTQVEILVLG